MQTIDPERLAQVVGGKGSGGKLPTVEAPSNINELLQSLQRK
ncbi:MAG: hypothetical protein ABI591_28120 [Kofleriaceae bacterium]